MCENREKNAGVGEAAKWVGGRGFFYHGQAKVGRARTEVWPEKLGTEEGKGGESR